MSSSAHHVRLNTVGRIDDGPYAGWYVFVHPQAASNGLTGCVVYQCTDATFAFEPGARQCFDQWVQDEESLADLFARQFGTVTWHPEIAPPIMRPWPRGQRLIDRFRARRNRASQAGDGADDPQDDG